VKRLKNFILVLVCLWLAAGFSARAANANSLVWHKATDRVDADIRGEALWPLLEQIAEAADWKIFVEPGAEHNASTKFKDLPSGDALHMLLGDLNFALVPQTNAPSLLYVFRTTIRNATKQVHVAKPVKRVANELLIRVKPGTDIDALAKSIGAKITGRMDKLGVYRLQFGDAAATAAALAQLQSNSDVSAVDYNYILDPPPTAQPISSTSVPSGAGPVSLKLNPPKAGDPCSPIIGMIDTGIQSSSLGNLNQSILPPISVVGDAGSGASPQSIGDPVEIFAPKQVATAGNLVYPTHGTAMIQTLFRAVSQSSGGASSVRVLPVDVYGTGETTTSWNVALGVKAAVDNGATILNLSLGGSSDSSVLDSVIQQAMAGGVLVFAAAGNTPVNSPTYPGAIPGVYAVTALGQPGQLASYANFWPGDSMALPGASIVYLGSQAYVVQGTSPATAYASGIAAGTKSVDCLEWAQIISAMQGKFPVPKN
jgi:Subtilase family